MYSLQGDNSPVYVRAYSQIKIGAPDKVMWSHCSWETVKQQEAPYQSKHLTNYVCCLQIFCMCRKRTQSDALKQREQCSKWPALQRPGKAFFHTKQPCVSASAHTAHLYLFIPLCRKTSSSDYSLRKTHTYIFILVNLWCNLSCTFWVESTHTYTIEEWMRIN